MPPTRGVYRSVHSALLDDPDYQALTTDAQHVLLTARLCKAAGPAAIFRYYPDLLGNQAGMSPKRVMAALAELARNRWVEYDDTVLWIRNGLRYDPVLSLADPKHRVAIVRSLADLPRSKVTLNFCDYYQIDRPFDGASMTLRSTEKDKEKDKEKEKDTAYASEANASAAPAITFHIPEDIEKALRDCPLLGTTPRLRHPGWWQAQLKTNGRRGVDLPREVLKAEAWLVTNPRRPRKDLARFLHNWLARAEGGTDG